MSKIKKTKFYKVKIKTKNFNYIQKKFYIYQYKILIEEIFKAIFKKNIMNKNLKVEIK